ncbi:unnamed protein product [Urochloa humidicola]
MRLGHQQWSVRTKKSAQPNNTRVRISQWYVSLVGPAVKKKRKPTLGVISSRDRALLLVPRSHPAPRSARSRTPIAGASIRPSISARGACCASRPGRGAQRVLRGPVHRLLRGRERAAAGARVGRRRKLASLDSEGARSRGATGGGAPPGEARVRRPEVPPPWAHCRRWRSSLAGKAERRLQLRPIRWL